MPDLLPSSSSRTEITPRSVVAGMIIHLLVLEFALVATRTIGDVLKQCLHEEPLLLIVPRSPEPPAQADPPGSPRVGPPPERFQQIPLAVEVPQHIPPIDLNQRALCCA